MRSCLASLVVVVVVIISALLIVIAGSEVAERNGEAICEMQLEAMLQGLGGTQLWAMELFDTWGSWPSGQFAGNRYTFGSYDQCRSFVHNHDDAGEIRGHYCMAVVPRESDNQTRAGRFVVDMKGINGVGIGMCFPQVCADEQLQGYLKRFVELRYHITSDYSQVNCAPEAIALGGKRIAAITIFSLVAALVVASTVYEIVSNYRAVKPSPLPITFSLYSNWINLMSIKAASNQVTKKSASIDCLHGLRVLAILWIIFGHSYMMVLSAPLINPVATLEWIASVHSALIVAGVISVDTFLVLSGLLTCWSLLRELDRNRRLNVPLLYLHRYLRLTPPFAVLILFTVGVYPNFGSGPLWNSSLAVTADLCNKYWWSALLYIQNYVNPNEMCLGHSWYLSVDMQLFLLAPFIIYPLWRWGWRILLVVIGLIIASIACILAVTMVYDLRANILLSCLERDRYSYVPTHTRMGAWFVGLILGYILHRTRDDFVSLPRWKVSLGWTITAGLLAGCVFGFYPLNQPDYEQNPLIVDALYDSFKHVSWAVAVSWIIFACVNGYGGPVNGILCLPIWQPLGRLSYCLYLLHLPIQTMLTGSLRTVRHFSDLQTVHTFWGDFSLTLIVAVAWTLCFEAPVGKLDGLLLGRGKKVRPTMPLKQAS
ncbi:nose resistant to fluoxetine protein 6-like [Wyeomyia smithii]|uniref:nose resistant to fluoxetine protein 6-like n=1 Tax=Wyeomyia smithii TaxID=174621 RepID=UPI002467E418|nr:nose resistant to fluoxetine protein 6-like [Wyeomyia smithii]